MNKTGPIIIIEDNPGDQEILKEIFEHLNYPNKLIFFSDGQSALEFLNAPNIVPFIILSDINLPKLGGFEVRNQIKKDSKVHLKCIPYIFFSSVADHRTVIEAYSLSAQGIFRKQDSIDETEKSIRIIMEYWMRCAVPNHFEHDRF